MQWFKGATGLIKKFVTRITLFLFCASVSLSLTAETIGDQSFTSKIFETSMRLVTLFAPEFDSELAEAYFKRRAEANEEPHRVPRLPLDVTLRQEMHYEMEVYIFEPATSPDETAIIFYLHGGGYVNPPGYTQFYFLDKLASDTGYAIHMPLYPRAPNHTHSDAHPKVEAYYQQVLEENPDKRIILMGDSAGGGFALALAQTRLIHGQVMPERIVLIAPWLDIALSNPEIPDYQAKDPMLDAAAARYIGEIWRGHRPEDYYRVSPLHGPIDGLSKISLVVGTYDILYPDTRRLIDRLEAAGVSYEDHVHEKMIHNYPLYPLIRESREAYKWILGQIQD